MNRGGASHWGPWWYTVGGRGGTPLSGVRLQFEGAAAWLGRIAAGLTAQRDLVTVSMLVSLLWQLPGS